MKNKLYYSLSFIVLAISICWFLIIPCGTWYNHTVNYYFAIENTHNSNEVKFCADVNIPNYYGYFPDNVSIKFNEKCKCFTHFTCIKYELKTCYKVVSGHLKKMIFKDENN
jgi:hypothetical protein